jgi:hypothetical protein
MIDAMRCNADIRAYATLYERQFYDLGTIRDEAEFKV